ncbi:hypothetical protein B0H63DRAFT_455920 [Podospora didyma]|uniref:Uncharacterized protein n=1 Tax=Podospora didyma TaxID=330526 RepID=A0AAE0K0Q9_9PEZI|nr:hypothetical protein B0H63DRAFT_455920 [Podospora didyma]
MEVQKTSLDIGKALAEPSREKGKLTKVVGEQVLDVYVIRHPSCDEANALVTSDRHGQSPVGIQAPQQQPYAPTQGKPPGHTVWGAFIPGVDNIEMELESLFADEECLDEKMWNNGFEKESERFLANVMQSIQQEVTQHNGKGARRFRPLLPTSLPRTRNSPFRLPHRKTRKLLEQPNSDRRTMNKGALPEDCRNVAEESQWSFEDGAPSFTVAGKG